MQYLEPASLGFDGDACEREYRSDLATVPLIAEVRRLLAMGRRVERLVCRYLADMADRIQQGQDNALMAYADELHAARCFFGLGVRDTRKRVRVGRALRQLPQVEAAFVDRELSYSRVREVTRVAEPHTEAHWLGLALTLDMRALERTVAAARASSSGTGGSGSEGRPDGGERPNLHGPIRTEWLNQHALRVSFELSAESWAMLERALEGARCAAASTLSDAEALAAIARDALSAQTRDPDASDPRRSVVIYECKSCASSALDTGVGLLELPPGPVAAIGCGVTETDLASEGSAVRRGGPLPSAIRRTVMLRDHCRCRVPGCNRRRYVDVHHIVAQANGGMHSRRNCLVLCTTHHRLLHEGKLQVSGDAEGELSFLDARGQPLVYVSAAAGDRARATEPGATLTASPQNPRPDATSHAHTADTKDTADTADTPNDIAWGTTQGGIFDEPAKRLLEAIGRRGGWSIDALIERTGLSASAVTVALMSLELGGRLRYHDFVFDPV